MEVDSTLWSIRHVAALSACAACVFVGPKCGVEWETVFTCLPMALIGCVIAVPCAIDVLLALCVHTVLHGLSLCPHLSSPEPFPEPPPRGLPSLQLPQLCSVDTDESTTVCTETSDTMTVDVHYVVFDYKSRFAEDLMVLLLLLSTTAVSMRQDPPLLAVGLTVALALGVSVFFQRRRKETLLTSERVPVSRPLATLAASICGGCYQNAFLLPYFLMIGLPATEAAMTALTIACFPLASRSLADVVQANVLSTTNCLFVASFALMGGFAGLMMKEMPSYAVTVLTGAAPLCFAAWQFDIQLFIAFIVAWWIRTSSTNIPLCVTKKQENTWTKSVRTGTYLASIATTAGIAGVFAYGLHTQLPLIRQAAGLGCVVACVICDRVLPNEGGARVRDAAFFTGTLSLSLCSPLLFLRGVACGALWEVASTAYPTTSFHPRRWYKQLSLLFVFAAVLTEMYMVYRRPVATPPMPLPPYNMTFLAAETDSFLHRLGVRNAHLIEHI